MLFFAFDYRNECLLLFRESNAVFSGSQALFRCIFLRSQTELYACLDSRFSFIICYLIIGRTFCWSSCDDEADFRGQLRVRYSPVRPGAFVRKIWEDRARGHEIW
jgi:hypothetical protein